ncbi:MAG: DUF2232 domain-containing protein [Anaerovoracaceae bacterium]
MYLSLAIFVAIFLPIPVISRAIIKRVPPYRAILEGIVGAAVGTTLVFILAAASGNSIFSIMSESIDYMAKILASNQALIESLDMTKATQAEKIVFFTNFYGEAADAIPSVICIIAAVSGYIEYIILSKIIKPGGSSAFPMAKFRYFSLPRKSILGWAIIYLFSWGITALGIWPDNVLYLNVSGLFNFTFCLQGMAVVFTFCYRKRIHQAIAVIIIAFLFISGIGQIVLLLLGILDLVIGLKGRLR